MPPRSFRYCAKWLAPSVPSMPAKANTPVIGEAMATGISLASCAPKPRTHGAGNVEANAPAPSPPRIFLRSDRMHSSLNPLPALGHEFSGSERPEGKALPGPLPDFVKTQRLEHEEADDQCPKDDGADRRQQFHRVRPIWREVGGTDLQELRNEGHEDGAENRAADRAEPADNDCGNKKDRLD